jgi:hypothetical protein
MNRGDDENRHFHIWLHLIRADALPVIKLRSFQR